MTLVSRSGGFSPRSASYRGSRAPAELPLSNRTTDTTMLGVTMVKGLR